MDAIWNILGIDPTQDVSAIKRAYALKSRTCHPEEDQEGFLQLRQAYQAALDYAERRDVPTPPAAALQNDREDEPDEAPQEEPEKEPNWDLREQPDNGPNPFEGGEAIRKFLDLYTGKQRKNPKLWMDYLSSDAFLDAAWDGRFTALLLEKITELEQTCPPNKEFLMWLSVVYQYSLKADQGKGYLVLAPGAEFDGVEFISRIAQKGVPPKRLSGNEFAMLQSFQDYRHLVHLAEAGRWDQEALDAYREVLGRYASAYIRERCEQRVTPDCERHPAGLRVFTHFFQRDDLPEAVYRDAWQRLDLKSAVMGRARALYGPLRDRVLEKVPGIDQKKTENFLRVNQNLSAHIARVKADPASEDEASATFFASEEVQAALSSPRFIEKELLPYSPWRREDIGEGLVRRILDFYRAHPDIPRGAEAAAVMEEKLLKQTAKRRSREDAQAEVPVGPPSLAYRPFFRHWLNTGFYTARDPESGTMLLEYLGDHLPYQKEWSRRFAETPVTVVVGNVEIDFCPLHMEFRVDGAPVYHPCLPWERTASAETDDQLLFLLPITVAPYSAFDNVFAVILDRLSSTAAPEEDRAAIARYLAEQVCCLPPEGALPLELYAEGGERLYVCVWQEDGERVTLSQQTASGRRILREYRPDQGETLMDAARWLLAEAVSPTRFDLSRLRILPRDIYFTANGGEEVHLIRPDLLEEDKEEQMPLITRMTTLVTEEALSSLLIRFGRDELERLEMDWSQGRLVLRRDGGKYACLYFENDFGFGENWYALLSDVDMYMTVDCKEIVYLPFGMGKLPEYSIHHSAASIMGDLEEVLAQMGWAQLQGGGRGGWKWSCDVNRQDARHKLFMAQQKMGSVPPQRARNDFLLAKFVFSRYPVQLERVDLAGERTLIDIRPGGYGQAAVELVQFMQQKLSRLRLTWTFKPSEGEPYQRHLVLMQDNGRYILLWLQDDKKRADIYASDAPVTFLGHIFPACLVHRDLLRIRNCVDLLLDDIDNTEPVVDRPGEFVPISLPYEEIRTALVKED